MEIHSLPCKNCCNTNTNFMPKIASKKYFWNSLALFSTSYNSLYEITAISMTRLCNVILATGLVAFAAAGLSFPFYMATSRAKPVIDSSKPLPPQATFRGPYINTGSRDIGPDSRNYPKT